VYSLLDERSTLVLLKASVTYVRMPFVNFKGTSTSNLELLEIVCVNLLFAVIIQD